MCFVRPFYGVLLWAVVAFLNPQQYIWGGAAFFPWAMAVAIPTLAGMLFFSRGWRNLASFKVFLLVVLWLWFTVTSLVSTSTTIFMDHAGDTWFQWRFVSKVLLMTGVTIAVVDSFARLRILVMVMAGSLGFYVAKALPFIFLTGGAFRLYGPANSMIADNNDFGLALNMTLPLFFFLAQSESNPWIRRLCAFLFLITIPAIFFTYSRGALVGLAAVGGLMLIRLKQRWLIAPVIVLGMLGAIMFAPQSWRDRMNPGQGLDNSARERINAWTFSWNLASDYPITGGGFATFTPELFARYAPTANDVKGPHSVYFQVLGEHGFVGLFLYLSLVVSCLLSVGRLAKRAQYHEDAVIANYARMFQFSIIGFLVSGLFLGRAYFDYFLSIVGCLIILEAVARREWARTVEPPEEENDGATTEEALQLDDGVSSW